MEPRRRNLVRTTLVVVVSLVIATLAVELLERSLGVANASSLYLVAVVLSALVSGTSGAIAVAAGSFLVYNFLFTEPRFTFTIHDPGVLLSVVLLLFVGIVVAELAALQRGRAEAASAREREARAMFAVSRSLATRDSTVAALERIAEVLRAETRMTRVWVAIGTDPALERVAADTGAGQPLPGPARFLVLQRTAGDEPARWTLVQRPSASAQRAGGPAAIGQTAGGMDTYRVRIEASGELQGSVWAQRARDLGEPDDIETRLLATAADQLGQALAHDAIQERSRAAEIAQQSDALKSALLQSVSHDLRTPLATIRAAAGSLRPGGPLSDSDREASVDAIEREVGYLNRLVTNLLDLSRIEAGALRAHRDVFELDDALGSALESIRPRLGARSLEVDLAAPPVEVDPVFLHEAVANILDNAIKYTPDGARVRVAAYGTGDTRVTLTLEDDGPGVGGEAMEHLFDKFYRAPGAARGSRGGTGIGLAVARGLIEATGGRAAVRRSDLGGLAIDLELPMAVIPAQLATEPAS